MDKKNTIIVILIIALDIVIYFVFKNTETNKQESFVTDVIPPSQAS